MSPDLRHMMLCKHHPNTRFQQFQHCIVPAVLIFAKYHKMGALTAKSSTEPIYPLFIQTHRLLCLHLTLACLDCNTATSRPRLQKIKTPRRNQRSTYLPFLDLHIFTFDAESKCSNPTRTDDCWPHSSRFPISPLRSQAQRSSSSQARNGTKINAWYLRWDRYLFSQSTPSSILFTFSDDLDQRTQQLQPGP
jgi:hypothetical protein